MADVSQSSGLLSSLLSTGGSSAQIVMAVLLWQMRADLKSVTSTVGRHSRVLRRLVVGEPVSLDDLEDRES